MAGNKLKEILNLAHSETYGRFKDIIITSVIGILVNVLLGVIKIIVGTVANSVAVISDAVNNFADSVSSLVTIIAMAISGRGATRKHPFGFGRIEYFSSMIISVLILITGGEFLIESVKKILHPEATAYTPVTLVLLIVAIVAKILLGLYTQTVRHETQLAEPHRLRSGRTVRRHHHRCHAARRSRQPHLAGPPHRRMGRRGRLHLRHQGRPRDPAGRHLEAPGRAPEHRTGGQTHG